MATLITFKMRINSVNIINNKIYNTRQRIAFSSNSAAKNSSSQVVNRTLQTTVAWFGFGIALDMLSRHLKFSKSPFKNSIAVNGLIAAGAGIVTGAGLLWGKKKS